MQLIQLEITHMQSKSGSYVIIDMEEKPQTPKLHQAQTQIKHFIHINNTKI
jgi:hypothetical protein